MSRSSAQQLRREGGLRRRGRPGEEREARGGEGGLRRLSRTVRPDVVLLGSARSHMLLPVCQRVRDPPADQVGQSAGRRPQQEVWGSEGCIVITSLHGRVESRQRSILFLFHKSFIKTQKQSVVIQQEHDKHLDVERSCRWVHMEIQTLIFSHLICLFLTCRKIFVYMWKYVKMLNSHMERKVTCDQIIFSFVSCMKVSTCEIDLKSDFLVSSWRNNPDTLNLMKVVSSHVNLSFSYILMCDYSLSAVLNVKIMIQHKT